MVSIVIIMFYYLYLLLLRGQLDVLNCNELVPSDGHQYIDWVSPSCDGLCRCWEGAQLRLFPFALVSFIAYSFGFPGIVM